ncbi:ATP-dependent nuclease [Breznakiella homolactica]|uniref:AAA family ATPase n=1 Tax=Breznakiella homolactica TaxID=2798577 RepID=A0A7T7XPZ8_9SPIR|nr:AAA family ATPase [Breznakiella homolactica]QQO10347.1 ATP-binding protein [Breznakiella homolactica]
MALIKHISISNFLIFRKEITFILNDGVIIVGVNNSGKSAILKALDTYFNDIFDISYLNRTEYLSKGKDYNKSTIKIIFDLEYINNKELLKRLKNKYSEAIEITKTFVYRPDSETIDINYYVNGNLIDINKENDIKKLVTSVKVSYIHPQQGIELLRKAQDKLRSRLLARWGQHVEMTKTMADLDKQWQALKERAQKYLSTMLSSSLQTSWPGSEVNIEFPSKIDDMINISNIVFRTRRNEPAIPLTSQGTGAQVSILYNTHFILDSDRSLHKGEYHPIFLLEEPESFLHPDLIMKQIKTFMSNEWLNNIQLVITTHNPIMLAYSHVQEERVNWIFMDKGVVKKNNLIEDWNDDDIKEISKVMGDTNFEVYFYSSSKNRNVFIEDKSPIIRKILETNDINISRQLGGISIVKKYLDILKDNKGLLHVPTYFLVDGDKGIDEVRSYLEEIDSQNNTATRYKVEDNLFVIVLSNQCAFENLCDAWPRLIKQVYNEIYDKSGQILSKVPKQYADIVSLIEKRKLANKDEILYLIKSDYSLKKSFWDDVEKGIYKISKTKMADLKHLLH